MNKNCTITKHLKIRPAKRGDYDNLAHFHYRGHCPAVYTAIYAMYCRSGFQTHPFPVGVIVYTMPAIGLEARNIAIGSMFDNCRDRKDRIKMINENIRCISRVIIDPRYRGLGLAAKLVRQTMPLLNVPIIEAIAAMGHINPFFEKAGMTPCPTKLPRQCVKFIETLKALSIDERLFVEPARVQKKLDALDGRLKFWLEHQTRRFLNAYGKRKNMPPGIDRTRFILSKLTARPMYYIRKFNCSDAARETVVFRR